MKPNFLVIFLVILLSVQTVSAASLFNRPLKLGDRGSDVKSLQQLLNQDPDTIVSVSGLGSLGNESTYFGLKTKNALINFQNKHRSAILYPLGLTYGDGVLGSTTIDFINQTADSSTFEAASSSPAVSPASFLEILNTIKTVMAKYGSVAPVPPSITAPKIISTPASYNIQTIPTADHSLVRSLVGVDLNGNITTARSAITLTKIQPEEGGNGTLVTVYGSGFSTATPNKVYVAGEARSVASSDGKTLSFNVSAPSLGGSLNSNMATTVVSTSGIVTNSYTHQGYSVNGAQISIMGGNLTYSAGGQSGSLNGLQAAPGSGLIFPIGIYAVDKDGYPSNGFTFNLHY